MIKMDEEFLDQELLASPVILLNQKVNSLDSVKVTDLGKAEKLKYFNLYIIKHMYLCNTFM